MKKVFNFLLILLISTLTFGQEQIELVAPKSEIIGLRDQTTETGRSIRVLHYFDKKVFIGYGDGNANTGPIEIVYFNVDSNKIFSSNFIASTEGIVLFQESNRKLFAANADPKQEVDNNFGSVFCFDPSSDLWSKQTAIEGVVHVLAMTSFNDKIIIGSSSSYTTPAKIYSSDDDGITWDSIFSTLPSPDTSIVEFSRFIYLNSTSEIVLTSGFIYRVISDTLNEDIPFAYWLYKDKWESIPLDNDLGYLKSFSLNNDIYIIPSNSYTDSTISHYKFDKGILKETSFFSDSLRIINSTVIILKEKRKKETIIALFTSKNGFQYIRTSKDFKKWKTIYKIENGLNEKFISITYDSLKDDLFIGSKGGNLYRIPNLFINLTATSGSKSSNDFLK